MVSLQIKIFRSKGGFQLLEDTVNKWLSENPGIEVHDIKYVDNSYYASVLILYARK